MGLRDRLRRLRRASEEVVVTIEQPYGPPARFPESALKEAFMTNMQRLRGEDGEPHPFGLAARSPDPTWANSFYADDGGPVTVPPDLSE